MHVREGKYEEKDINEQYIWEILNQEECLTTDKPLNSPAGPPFSPPVVSIIKVLSLTPPITTSSKAPQARSLKPLSEKIKWEESH